MFPKVVIHQHAWEWAFNHPNIWCIRLYIDSKRVLCKMTQKVEDAAEGQSGRIFYRRRRRGDRIGRGRERAHHMYQIAQCVRNETKIINKVGITAVNSRTL